MAAFLRPGCGCGQAVGLFCAGGGLSLQRHMAFQVRLSGEGRLVAGRTWRCPFDLRRCWCTFKKPLIFCSRFPSFPAPPPSPPLVSLHAGTHGRRVLGAKDVTDLTRACMAGLVIYLMAGLAYNVKQKGMEMGPEALPHASLCFSLASGFGGLLVWTLPACKHPPPCVSMRLGLMLSNRIAGEGVRDSTPCPPDAPHLVSVKSKLRRCVDAGENQGCSRARNGEDWRIHHCRLAVPKLLIPSCSLPLHCVHAGVWSSLLPLHQLALLPLHLLLLHSSPLALSLILRNKHTQQH